MTERAIHASDLLAQLRRFGPAGASTAPLDRLAASGRAFMSFADLAAECPPERLGISPGAFGALFEPLFGEFE